MNFLLSENKASQIQRLTTIPALNWGMSETLYPHLQLIKERKRHQIILSSIVVERVKLNIIVLFYTEWFLKR